MGEVASNPLKPDICDPVNSLLNTIANRLADGDETEAQIFILKSRDGRIGMIPCRFNVRTFRFEQEHREGE